MQYFSSLVWIVCENHGYMQVKDLPSHQLMAQRGAVLTRYFAVTHPSGPNYRSMAAGEFWTHEELLGQEKPTVATQSGVETIVWNFKGPPARRHNPFADLHSPCTTTTDLDLESLPESCLLYVGMDDLNNGHSGPLVVADKNLQELLGRLDASAWFHRAVSGVYPALFLVWDEAYTPDNQVFASFLGAGVQPGASNDQRLGHFSFCRLVTDNWAKPPLGQAAAAPPISGIWLAP